MEILISKLEIKKYKSFGTLILWLFTFWSTTGYNSKTISERWTIVKSANYALNVSRYFAILTPQNGPKNVAQPIKKHFSRTRVKFNPLTTVATRGMNDNCQWEAHNPQHFLAFEGRDARIHPLYRRQSSHQRVSRWWSGTHPLGWGSSSQHHSRLSIDGTQDTCILGAAQRP